MSPDLLPPSASSAQVSFPSGPGLTRGQEAHLTVGVRPLQVPRLLRRCSGRGPGWSWRDAPPPTHAARPAGHSALILSDNLLGICAPGSHCCWTNWADSAPWSPYRVLKPGALQAAPGGGVCLTPIQPDPDMWAWQEGERGGSQGSRVQVGGGLPHASVSPAVPWGPQALQPSGEL